jgi:putative NADH-flavin reductase
MRVFLVGATGRTGKWILKAALARGHQVTALVRGLGDRIGISHPLLKVIQGDLFEMDHLAQALAGHDAVLSALNSSSVEAGTEKLVAAAESAGVTRFLGVAGGGILQLDQDRLRRDRPGYPQMFLKTSEGHLNAWKRLEASSLSWTLVCTPDLADAPACGRAKSREEYMPEGGNVIPCGDVAEFLINELEAPRFVRKRVGMTV